MLTRDEAQRLHTAICYMLINQDCWPGDGMLSEEINKFTENPQSFKSQSNVDNYSEEMQKIVNLKNDDRHKEVLKVLRVLFDAVRIIKILSPYNHRWEKPLETAEEILLKLEVGNYKVREE